jgi:glucose 1-dehydrogenase
MGVAAREGAQAPSPLSGRRAIVTGAATGIGNATAHRLLAQGAQVAFNYVGSTAPSETPAIEADVSREDHVQRLFSEAEEKLGGPVDLLVNNAGVESAYHVEDMPVDEWERILSVNLTGPFLCSREMVRRLPGDVRPATIVNVSSVHETIPWEGFAHYCASKGGLKLFAQTLAKELGPKGIRVSSVAPGAILTPINKQLIEDPDKRREQEGQVPLGRLGEPEEIAAAIAWLAGPDAAYVTGETLFVDGGMTLYPNFV